MVTDDCVDSPRPSPFAVKDSVVKWLPAFVGITGDDFCKHRAIVQLPIFANSSALSTSVCGLIAFLLHFGGMV